MLRDTAVARVQMLLGFKTGQDANVIQAMKEAQEQLENAIELPDFLRINYDDPFTTTIDEHVVDVPDNFIREWEQDQLNVVVNDVTTNLSKDELGYLRIRYPDSGVPIKYALVNKQFHLYPLPDQEYTLTGTYYARDVLLNTNIQNKWLEHVPELLISMAGIVMAASLRDDKALPVFAAIQQEAKMKVALLTSANDAAGSKPVIGGEN